MTKHKNEPFPYDNPFDIITKDTMTEEIPIEPVLFKQEQMEEECLEENSEEF